MITVLICDDEPNILELVRVTLEDSHTRVIEAEDGERALDLVATWQPELVLLDVQLPGISGLEVCRRLRGDARLAGTKIVMLTAAAQQTDIELGLSAGAHHYLTKPFSPVRLLTLVEQLLPGAPVWLRD